MTIKQIARNKKVESINDEGRNGIWAYLKPGWRCPAGDTHQCHEWTVEELAEAVRNAVPCDCEDCTRSRTIRVPACFYVDHLERGLATPEDLSKSSRHAVVRLNDPAINSLLGDAEWYADQQWDECMPRSIVLSARATVRAIRNVIGWDGASPAVRRKCVRV